MSADPASLTWSSQFSVAPSTRAAKLSGDKILLPPSALEALLAAAPVAASEPPSRIHPTAFDPFNTYTYAAEQGARAQFEERHLPLPHPLTFRLVNPHTGRAVYAGIREFSAEEGEIVLSPFLRESLGIDSTREASPSGGVGLNRKPDDDEIMADGAEETAIPRSSGPRITVHAKQLPKGTFVKLRPLEAGYDPEDWKSLLERHLRSNYTTLTNGEILVVQGGRGIGGSNEEYRFLIDGFKPEGDGVCVVDTDLEADIEALNEEQARETVKRIVEKRKRAPGTGQGSSAGGQLSLFDEQRGQVLDGEYVDYELPSWDRSQGVEIELSEVDQEDEIELFVSPFGPRQRVRPREEEHVFADFASRYPKRIRLQPTNVELEDAEAIWVSVHAYPDNAENAPKRPRPFKIRASVYDPNAVKETVANGTSDSETPPNPDDVVCQNCGQRVPKRTLFLHESFCLRNNIRCPQGCGAVFPKNSEALQSHWHCPHDTFTGDTTLSRKKHDAIFHTPQTCESCSLEFPTLPMLSQHKTSTCPGKLILCRFCHLQVPQEGDPETPNPEALLSGLTPHELADGARTTECHLCGKIVRLRDMDTHLKHHDLDKLNRPAPRVCRNINCGRTLDGVSHTGDTRAGTRKGQGPGNDISLCSVCFGPLYVSMYDPDGKALRRRVERRYMQQLLSGCGRPHCKNEFCKTGRKIAGTKPEAIPSKEALPMIKPFIDCLPAGDTPLHFCVDEASQRRRTLADMLSAEVEGTAKGGWSFEWCVGALEAENGDLLKAREWLKGWAPQRGEVA